MTEARPRVWTVFVVYIGALVAIGVVSVLVLGAVIASAGSRPSDPQAFGRDLTSYALSLRGVMLGTSVSSLLLAATALLSGSLSSERLAARLGLAPRSVQGLPLAAMLAGGVALGGCIGPIARLLLPEGAGILPIVSRVLASATGVWLAAAVVAVGLLPGACEELFFRGYMQTRLRRRWGAWPAILVTSGAFGLMHMDVAHTPYAFLMGIYLGWVTERAGSIWPATGAHIVNNVVAVVTATVWQAQDEVGIASMATCAVVFVGAVSLIQRGAPAAEVPSA